MTIFYPIDLPLAFVQRLRVVEENASSFRKSPFTRRGQLQEFEGDDWGLQVGWRDLDRTQAQPVLAFRSALRGSVGTFVTVFPGYQGPLGAASQVPSTPLVQASASAGDTVLPVKEAAESIEGWLLAGDIIQVGPANRPHWHRVLQDVDTDGTGSAEIDVWPRLREGVINNDPVEYDQPLCIFRQTGETNVDIEPPVLHSLDVFASEET